MKRREGEVLDALLAARRASPTLGMPNDIAVEREMHEGLPAYVFVHRELGLLGRLRLRPGEGQGSWITAEVAGEPDDPRTAVREAALRRATDPLVDRLYKMYGLPSQPRSVQPIIRREAVSPPSPPPDIIPTSAVVCETCGAAVAMLIFADLAQSSMDFEDVARIMFRHYKSVGLATWIVGPAAVGAQYRKGDVLRGEAVVMKAWPERGNCLVQTARAFNAIVRRLQTGHCATTTEPDSAREGNRRARASAVRRKP